MCCIIAPFPHDFDEFVIVKDVGHGKTVTSFTPTHCFVHRVDASSCLEESSPFFVYNSTLSLFSRCSEFLSNIAVLPLLIFTRNTWEGSILVHLYSFPTGVSPIEKSQMFRPLDEAFLGRSVP
jgi:hypothetical protein